MRGSHPNQLKSNLCAFLSILSILLSILSPPLCQAVPADWKTEKWQGFSVSMPPDWNVGDTTYTQASWNFGDTENGKYGFFGIFKSRVQPRQMPMEKGASLVPQGSVMIDGQPATDYDITFSTGDRRHHLICLDEPDFEGNYLFLMAGVVGMDFQSHWPTLTNVMETVKYNPSPPPEPPLDPSLATKTSTLSPSSLSPPEDIPSSETSDTPSIDPVTIPEGWKQAKWRGFSLAVPREWEALGKDDRDEMAWGVVDKDKKTGVTFGIVSQRKSIAQEKLEKWMILEKEEQTFFLGKPAKIIEISGSPGKDQPGMHILAITFDAPAADGKYIIFAGSVAGEPWETSEPIIQKIFASISGNPEQGVLEIAPKEVEPFQMWDVVTLSPAKGWITFGDKDGRLWMPIFKEEPQAVFMVMRGEKVDQTLSKMQIKTKKPDLLAGQEASSFTGTVAYYKETPVKVWVLDQCLPSGERLGVLMGGTDPDVYQKQLDTMMAGLSFHLPPECGPCQEMVTHNLKGISFKAPRYLATRTWEKLGVIDCKGTDIKTGAEFSVWLRMNRVTYAKESGGYKDEFRVVKRFMVGKAAATEFNTSIGKDEDQHLSRVVELDQKLANGKFLYLECYCKGARHWEALQPLIATILSSLQVDPSLLAANAGQYRTQVSPTEPLATSDENISTAAAPATVVKTPAVDPDPITGNPPPVQGQLIRKKGFGDLVGQGEKPGFNGSPDVILRLSITSPERTITAMALLLPEKEPQWDTLPGNQAWLLGVGQKNKLLNNASGDININLVSGEQRFDLYLQDKHLFDRGKTGLILRVTFEDGTIWETPLLEK